MTKLLMINWLHTFNKKIKNEKTEKKKSSDRDLQVENVKLVYLPPNTMSHAQSLLSKGSFNSLNIVSRRTGKKYYSLRCYNVNFNGC